MSDLFERAVEKIRRGESPTQDEALAMTAGERISLVWELTKFEWGITDDAPMRRDIARVIRRGESAD